MAPCLFRSRDHLLLRGVRSAETDIGPDGVVEQIDILKDHGDMFQQAVAGELPHIVPTHRNAATGYIIEPGDQAANGGLAAAGRPYDSGRRVLGDGEIHIPQNRPGIVAEVHMAERNVEPLQRDIPPILVDEVIFPQSVQLIHCVVDDAEDVGAVADWLQSGEDAEGEKADHQHHGQLQRTRQRQPGRGSRQGHGSDFQRQQVQTVGGNEAPLDFQADVPAVPDGLAHRRHRGPALSEGLHHRQAPGVLQRCRRQVPPRLGGHRGIYRAVAGYQKQEQEGQRRPRQGDQRGQRADSQQAQEDTQEIQIPADEAVHHADAHIFKRVQAGGDGIQDIPRIYLLKVAQGNPFQRLADGQPIPGHQLVADRLLEPGLQVAEQEPEQYQQCNDQQAQANPLPLQPPLDQQSHRISRDHNGHCREPGGEEGKHEADIQFSSELPTPADDTLDRLEHLTPPPFRIPPNPWPRCGPATSAGRAGRSAKVLPAGPGQ